MINISDNAAEQLGLVGARSPVRTSEEWFRLQRHHHQERRPVAISQPLIRRLLRSQFQPLAFVVWVAVQQIDRRIAAAEIAVAGRKVD